MRRSTLICIVTLGMMSRYIRIHVFAKCETELAYPYCCLRNAEYFIHVVYLMVVLKDGRYLTEVQNGTRGMNFLPGAMVRWYVPLTQVLAPISSQAH